MATMAASAMPAQAKTACHVLDPIDWWVVTGEISEYGHLLPQPLADLIALYSR